MAYRGCTRHICPVPIYRRGSIKRIFPEYWHFVEQAWQQYSQLTLGPVLDFCVGYPGIRTAFSHMATPLILHPGFLDETNFPQILNRTPPRGAKGMQYPKLALGPVPELWLRGKLPGGQNYVYPHGDPPSLVFRLSRVYPECWPMGPLPTGSFYTVPPLNFAWLPRGVSLQGGTRHRSPVPNYPLGLDKTNFPRILTPRGAMGATIPTTQLVLCRVAAVKRLPVHQP